MMAPFAPVQAGLAYRTARMGERFSRYLQAALHESLALGGEFDRLLAVAHQPLPFHAVEHLHAEIARQMVIADPRAAQRRVLRARAHAHGTGAAIVTVAALLLRLDQAAGFQL